MPKPAAPTTTSRRKYDPYSKLLNRFFESLILLRVMGQTRGKHTAGSPDRNEEESRRRRFFRNLSYLCDHDKGGSTCTAIAVEATESCYNVWVAVNQHSHSISTFLEKFLANLARLVSITSPKEFEALQKSIMTDCLKFASLRIQKDMKLLFKAITRYQDGLGQHPKEIDLVLSKWLQKILASNSPIEICHSAYEAAKSPHSIVLNSEAAKEKQFNGLRQPEGSLTTVRHFIGRLASRIFTHMQIVEDAPSLVYILESYRVRNIPIVHPVAPPADNSCTTLNGILNRMLNKDNKDRPKIEDAIMRMEREQDLFGQFVEELNRCKPYVHAEIQVLEHFFHKRLEFVANDRFIATSKPACYGCKLYFQSHPARMVVPGSSEKVWLNWSPPAVDDFKKEKMESRIQLDVLNEMIAILRRGVIGLVMKSSCAQPWHADSQTGMSDISISHRDYIILSHMDSANKDQWDQLTTEDDETTIVSNSEDSDTEGGVTLDD